VTFSIVARTPGAEYFGVAVASSSPAVAARCAHARAGVGAVATQNITDPTLGPTILESLSCGGAAQGALDAALGATPYAAYRQVLVMPVHGPPLIHSGVHALGIVSCARGTDAGLRTCDAGGRPIAHPVFYHGHSGEKLARDRAAGAHGVRRSREPRFIWGL